MKGCALPTIRSKHVGVCTTMDPHPVGGAHHIPRSVHHQIDHFDSRTPSGEVTIRVESHFKNEGIYRFGPPPLFRWTCDFFFFSVLFFFIFPKEMHFPIEKKEAPQAPKKKMMPRRRRRRGKNIYRYIFFFSILFFWKNNSAKLWKFWKFLSCCFFCFFFYYGFH